MLTPVEVILGGIIVAVVSGAVVKIICARDKMSEDHCNEKRVSCQSLILAKVDNVEKKVDSLISIVNGKILGL
jgi:hypothetical protein